MQRFSLLLSIFAMLVLIGGCGPKPVPPANSNAKPEAQPAAEHTHGAGPHGGTVADWGGGKYHVEFTVDHDKKEATLYILGDDEKTPSPIKTQSIQLSINDPPAEIELAALPLEGEAEGTSSRFVGTHDVLGTERPFAGTITGEIEGTPYTGDFKEEPAK